MIVFVPRTLAEVNDLLEAGVGFDVQILPGCILHVGREVELVDLSVLNSGEVLRPEWSYVEAQRTAHYRVHRNANGVGHQQFGGQADGIVWIGIDLVKILFAGRQSKERKGER